MNNLESYVFPTSTAVSASAYSISTKLEQGLLSKLSNSDFLKISLSSIVLMASLASTNAFSESCGNGAVGKFICEVGKATGNKLLENAGRSGNEKYDQLKDEVPIIKEIDEAVSRPVRETAKWVDKNKEEAAAAALVITAGALACIDGCALVGTLLAGPVVLDAFEVEPESKEDQGSISKDKEDTEAIPDQEVEGEEIQADSEENSEDEYYLDSDQFTQEIYPSGFSKANFDSGTPKPIIRYRSLSDQLGEVFNTYAITTKDGAFRLPGGPTSAQYEPKPDVAGGSFESPRTYKANIAKYGETARRTHAGIDFHTIPGDPVLAPMSGEVVNIGPMSNRSGLHKILIRSKDGSTANILYAKASAGIKVGDPIMAGEFVGVAENIIPTYGVSTPNHIHVQFTDSRGRRIDPYNNKVIEDIPFVNQNID